MREKLLELLLSNDEGVSLEFKESLDLESKEGKAKFLREVLSLANSQVETAYIVAGIEDKTKKVIGISGITEEQVQQVVSEWCRPPIDFDFEIKEHEDKFVGVMRIYPSHQPHSLKKSISYPETADGKKQTTFHENQVFMRRGSTIAEANVDEILEMAQQDSPDLSTIVSRLDKMTDSIEDIADSLNTANDHQPGIEIDRFIEATFVAMVAGLIAAWFWVPDILLIPILAFVVSFFAMVTTSAFRLTHFGIWRAILLSMVISIGLGVLFNFGLRIAWSEQLLFANFVARLIFGLLAGAVTGVVGQIIVLGIDRGLIRR